ncbi:MAG: hypothetical protein Q9160_007300 [Pyrenula sp. 1 TL-2023]
MSFNYRNVSLDPKTRKAMTSNLYHHEPEVSADDGREHGLLQYKGSQLASLETTGCPTESKDLMNDSGYGSALPTSERNSTTTVAGEDLNISNESNRPTNSDPIPRRLQELDSLLRFRKTSTQRPITAIGISRRCKAVYHRVLLKEVRRKGQKFFKKDWVKNLCEPRDEDVPRFQVYIVPRPTQLAATLVNALPQGTNNSLRTNCGTLVEFNNEWGKSRATLGGLIKVTQSNGEYTLCGLTSGHSLMEDGEDIFSVDDESDGRSLDDFDFSKSPNLADQWNQIDNDEDPPILDLGLHTSDANDVSASLLDEQIGVAFVKLAFGYDERPGNYDWALVQALSPSRYLRNLLRTPDSEQSASVLREGSLKLRDKPFQTDQLVIAMAGASGCLRGVLSPITTSLLLAPGTSAVKAYAVQFPDGSTGLREGDSGSWVVNESTREVIGTLSVLDAFGDAIVIPLADILDDIQKELGAASVQLPTTIDILSKRPQALTSPGGSNEPPTSDRGGVPSNVHEARTSRLPCPTDSGYASAEVSSQTSPAIMNLEASVKPSQYR